MFACSNQWYVSHSLYRLSLFLVINSFFVHVLVSLIHRSLKKVGEKKIYLLTDAGSEYSDDGLESICAGLEKEGIELVVV